MIYKTPPVSIAEQFLRALVEKSKQGEAACALLVEAQRFVAKEDEDRVQQSHLFYEYDDDVRPGY
jgi:hypothetical protein